MVFAGSRLVTPPSEKEIYPYRSVWRSVVIENGLFTTAMLIVYFLASVLGLNWGGSVQLLTLLALVFLPLVLWFIFSYLAERRVLQPRQGLLRVLILSGLVANAVGIPLIEDTIQIDNWIALEPALSRIVGYTITVGIAQEFIKYLVVYYTVWPQQFRTRLDGIAYAAPVAIGYATIENLRYVVQDTPPIDAAILRIFSTVVIHLIASCIVAYGLSALCFDFPSPVFMPIVLFMSATVVGLAIPLRAGLVNATFALGVSSPRGLLSLIFTTGILVVPLLIVAFLINNAERRQRESLTGRETS